MARPRVLFIVISLLASLFVPHEQAWAQYGPAESVRVGLVHLESVPTRRVRATLTLDANTPNLDAREWIILAPQPTELPGQSQIRSSLAVDGCPVPAPESWERSEGHRPILCAHVPVASGQENHALRVKAVYEATLYARRLVAGPSPIPVTALSPGERRLATASTQTTDWSGPAFRRWLKRMGLQRASHESDPDFAARTFQAIRGAYVYVYDPDQDRRASAVCQGDHADCGGLSNLFVAALRANGVPARLIVGRWAHTAGPADQCHQLHVKSEFYAQNVGWVPVEMSGAVSDKFAPAAMYFGRDTGEFLTLSVNADFLFDTGGWGVKHLLSLQGPCYWGVGDGTFIGCTEQVAWDVVPEELDASASPPVTVPAAYGTGR